MKYLASLFIALSLPFSGLLAADKPNILFIITDDMYPWQMNFMPEGEGKNYTPNIDRLADEGIVMRNQYVSSTVCTPSRYSVMTGRYASRSQAPEFLASTEDLGQTHVQWNTFADPLKEKTVAHRLQDAGYRTGFVGKDHVILTRDRKRLGLSSDPEDPVVLRTMHENADASRKAFRAANHARKCRRQPQSVPDSRLRICEPRLPQQPRFQWQHETRRAQPGLDHRRGARIPRPAGRQAVFSVLRNDHPPRPDRA
jgi:arylsulfatase A-like enzyme